MKMPASRLGGNRREFLRDTARYGLLSLLVAIVAGNARKWNQPCVNQGLCRQCPIFAECGLPQRALAQPRPGGS
jgi:hypothetical protein